MKSLANKNILLGVTGGIAAYKSAEIVRHLKKSGASVRVVMTKSAEEFITPLTLQALSGNRVSTELLDAEAEAAACDGGRGYGDGGDGWLDGWMDGWTTNAAGDAR